MTVGADLDKIFIESLKLSCFIGIEKSEHSRPQALFADIMLFTDPNSNWHAAASDSISDTVDYKPLTDSLLQAASESRFKLIESLAELLAALCLKDSRVVRVTVTIRKPSALRDASCAGVEITRTATSTKRI